MDERGKLISGSVFEPSTMRLVTRPGLSWRISTSMLHVRQTSERNGSRTQRSNSAFG